jgi:hypothetical protein
MYRGYEKKLDFSYKRWLDADEKEQQRRMRVSF